MIDGTERRRWEWVASRTDFNGGAVRGIVDVRYLSTQPWGTISSAHANTKAEGTALAQTVE